MTVRRPQVSDVWVNGDEFMRVLAIHECEGELVGATVQHSGDREGTHSDVMWPDGFAGWECGVCGALTLEERAAREAVEDSK